MNSKTQYIRYKIMSNKSVIIVSRSAYYNISPRSRQDLFLSEAPKGLRVVSNVKFTQESKNLFLMIIQVDLRHEILLQS